MDCRYRRMIRSCMRRGRRTTGPCAAAGGGARSTWRSSWRSIATRSAPITSLQVVWGQREGRLGVK
eukprot:4992433-Pyramimonas_sp.AAC.1